MAVSSWGYSPSTGGYDEAVTESGDLRGPWGALAASLAHLRPGELLERQRQADRLLDAEGAGHMVHELAHERATADLVHERPGAAELSPSRRSIADSRPWRLDPVPFVVEASEFARLEAAVRQRVRLLEAVLADLYGARRLVREGVLPAQVVFAAPGMRTSAAGRAPARWIVHYGLDLVRLASGEWRVAQDLVDAPAGAGYALLNRAVTARVLSDVYRQAGVVPIDGFTSDLREALASTAPAGRRSPRVVVLTGGPGHATYVEHSYLAMQLGYHLAEGGDLVVRRNRLWMRSLTGLEPVDVVYRRLEDASLDPLEPHIQGAQGVPAITWAAQHGGVSLANAFGTRVVEEDTLAPYLPGAARALLGEDLLLGRWRDDDVLATAPVYGGARRDAVVEGRAVLRLHATVGADGVRLLPGGIARVLAPGDHPCRPTAQLVKDVWVVGGAPALRLQVRRARLPQVDFGTSVPKRAADALFWMSRAAERAECAARSIRVLGGRILQDPTLPVLTDGAWGRGATALLRAAQAAPGVPDGHLAGLPIADRLAYELGNTQATLVEQIATLVQEATSVREFLSTTTGRVLGRLTRVRSDLLGSDAAGDDLDVVLVDLAALAGLTMESTVRGPAWRFCDLGRRLERALVVLGSIEAGLGVAADPLTFQPLAESVLQVNESLVAYRRQYRSDVELSAVVDLLVHDDGNPRSLSFQLDRMREHVASLGWPEGAEHVQRASIGALAPIDDTVSGGRRLSVDALVLGARGPLLELAGAIVARWFADPVNPTSIGGA